MPAPGGYLPNQLRDFGAAAAATAAAAADVAGSAAGGVTSGISIGGVTSDDAGTPAG